MRIAFRTDACINTDLALEEYSSQMTRSSAIWDSDVAQRKISFGEKVDLKRLN